MSYFPDTNFVSTVNSSSSLLAAAAVFTGTSEDVSQYNSVVVSVKTDQDGTFSVQFSNDNTNWDSTLTRYYRTNQIEAPHRFTITRKYCRVVFTNTSASDQTYLRLQTVFGEKSELNAPSDSTLAQDFDATVSRPTDFKYEVALGLRQGYTLWNKFGHNLDIDTGTETVWSTGGLFVPIVTARTLSVVSSSTADDDGSTGANSIIIYGIDADWKAQTVVVTMDGTTPVVTTETWLGINRMSIYVSGTGGVNAGIITATATTEATVQAEIPLGLGTSQHGIFFVQAGHQILMDWLYITLVKNSGGTQPELTAKCWVTSAVSGSKYEVFRDYIQGSLKNHTEIRPSQPFVVGEKSIVDFQATTDQNNTEVSIRFSLIEARTKDT